MFNFRFTKQEPDRVEADIFFIDCQKKSGDKKGPGRLFDEDGGTLLDRKLGGLISRIIREEEFEGELGGHKVIYTDGKIVPKKIVILGIGTAEEFDLDTCRRLGSKIAQISDGLRAEKIAFRSQPKKINNLSAAERMQALAEGLVLGGYRFEKYKDKKGIRNPTLKTIVLSYKGDTKPISKAFSLGSVIADAINYARDLVNTPADEMTPERIAKESTAICRGTPLSCKVLGEKEIEREKMGLILAVSKGASNPPRFIHMQYKPARKARLKIALIGKGVTFDSGGYNLKPTRHIEVMKCDMAGAAALLAVMKLMPVIRPKVAVDAFIPAAENMIDGRAGRPGDIAVSRSGKTVEINNTDCEGRLLLADAFNYALEKKPNYIIDLATLTGGVLYALGEIYTAILGNDQRLIDRLIGASKRGGEPTWQLPLEKEYLKGFKEGIADLYNMGKTSASTISGALFLSEFIGKTRWAHLDIAESAWANEDRDYRFKGGTGAGVQTLVRFLMSC